MATVYHEVNGEAIERLIARQEKVQARLVREANRIAVGTAANMAGHHRTYNAQPTMGRGDIDMYVYLENDPDASYSAMDIEYGHWARDKTTWVEGLWALHDAAGLPHKPRGSFTL